MRWQNRYAAASEFYRGHFMARISGRTTGSSIRYHAWLVIIGSSRSSSSASCTEPIWAISCRGGAGQEACGVATFEGDELAHEHIYWDQASVLGQVGVLDAGGIPVVGAEQAAKLVDLSGK